ncbi:class I SAM-dependent methyltransferase [Actinosynnema sp. CS-041913]|uniref:class I SAM-dependent methyltransferase n=1 Tax=Actinosynnema sp. CS-041913 TaxID=3239917 RepID=UPI003D94D4E1
MVDHLFADARLAALYDDLCAGRADFAYYLPLVMSADSVLDVGCGTGELLRLARAAGHTGRLCGLDPAAGMLAQARRRSDVDWVHGDLASVSWRREFDLIVMTGHAFQVFVTDDELRSALRAIRAALTDDGRFAFETRNPAARAWERWTPGNAVEVTDASGAQVRVEHDVKEVDGDLVRFTQTYTSPGWSRPEVSWSTLRFLNGSALAAFLSEAHLRVAEQFGDWDRSPLAEACPEIITTAVPSPIR